MHKKYSLLEFSREKKIFTGTDIKTRILLTRVFLLSLHGFESLQSISLPLSIDNTLGDLAEATKTICVDTSNIIQNQKHLFVCK